MHGSALAGLSLPDEATSFPTAPQAEIANIKKKQEEERRGEEEEEGEKGKRAPG